MRFVLLAIIPALCFAQDVPEKKTAPKTPRELAAQLLESAYDGVSLAQPNVQPFLLWRMADCYTVLDEKKAREILDQAFSGAAVLGSQASDLESNIALAMSELDLPRSIEMLRAVKQEVLFGTTTRDLAIEKLIRRLLGEKNVDGAIETLNLLAGGAAYPYGAADAILKSVDKENDPHSVIVFGSALTAYQTRPAREFGKLVANNWEKIPTPQVTQALDAIVNHLADLKDPEMQFKITYMGTDGNAELSHEKDIELHDIAAPLRAIEPEKAKQLFEQSPELDRAAKLFPEGEHTKGFLGMSVGIVSVGDPPPSPEQQQRQASFALNMTRQAEAIAAAAKDLQAGLDLIPRIPSPNFQAGTYSRLANERVSSYPSTARKLLAKAIDIDVKIDDDQMVLASQDLLQAVETATRLKDDDLAKKALDGGFEIAARMYSIDSTPDEPNLDPFEIWPSVHFFRQNLVKAVELYKMKALTYLDGIKEPDLLITGQIALAAGLLGRQQSGAFGGLHLHKKKEAHLDTAPLA